MSVSKDDEKLLNEISQVKKCCGITIMDVEVGAHHVRGVCCTLCNRQITESESDNVIREWNEGILKDKDEN